MGHINVFDVVGTLEDWPWGHNTGPLKSTRKSQSSFSIAGYNLRECKANSTPTLPERPSLG